MPPFLASLEARMAVTDRIKSLPLVGTLLRLRYERGVRHGSGWWLWGSFTSYEEAMRSVPPHPEKAAGYDAPAVATQGAEVYERMHLFDYPALHWIRALTNGASGTAVVDLGGHLGEKLRAYQRLWSPPTGTTWTVIDTPATVEAARTMDIPSGEVRLSFTTDREVARGADVLFASGSLQYLDWDFPTWLSEEGQRPAGIVINKLPVWGAAERWTLQNAGNAIVPHRFFEDTRFFRAMDDAGYDLLDRWEAWERRMTIPFEPELPEAVVIGCAFRRRS